MKSFIDEFKSFAMRGNVVDLAVAVVIGGAFGKIVSSLVDKIVMPLLSFLTGGLDLTYLVWTLRPAVGEKAALVVGYGAFFQSVIDFIIIALAIFVVIKQMNRLMKKEDKEEKKKEEKKTPEDVVLLTEIRDLLKKNK